VVSELDEGPRAHRAEEQSVDKWNMPWACPRCENFGWIRKVVVAKLMRTTDDQLWDAIDRAHKEMSMTCPVSPDRILRGRLCRLDNAGEVVWLLREGETQEQLRLLPWPPWRK